MGKIKKQLSLKEQFDKEAYVLITKNIKIISKRYSRNRLEQMTDTTGFNSIVETLIADFYIVFLERYDYFYEKWFIDPQAFQKVLYVSIDNYFSGGQRQINRKLNGYNIYKDIKDAGMEIGNENMMTSKKMNQNTLLSLLTDGKNNLTSKKDLIDFIHKIILNHIKINKKELCIFFRQEIPNLSININFLYKIIPQIIKEEILSEVETGEMIYEYEKRIFDLVADTKFQIVSYQKNKQGCKLNKSDLKEWIKQDVMPACGNKIYIRLIKKAILHFYPSLAQSKVQLEPKGFENGDEVDVIESIKQTIVNPVIETGSNESESDLITRLEQKRLLEKLPDTERKIIFLILEGNTFEEASAILADEGKEFEITKIWRIMHDNVNKWHNIYSHPYKN